jgi:RNA polymerase sigma factor (sigma-70 family)
MTSPLRPRSGADLGVFARYTRELHRYLVRRLRRPADVDDLSQEVYLRLLRMNQNRLVHKPLAYLYGVAAHVVADFHKRNHELASSEESSDVVEQLLPDNLAERLNLQQQLERALAQLPPMHAAVLLAHKRDGLSYEEVAQELNLSVHTVAIYVKQAKARIRMMQWER